MTIPNLGNMRPPDRTPPGVREVNFGDQWRGVFSKEDAPADGRITHAYVVIAKDDRGYVLRPRDTEHWGILEVEIPEGSSVEDAVREAALRDAAAHVARLVPSGHLMCKATRHNTEYSLGDVTYRGFYVGVASAVDPPPDDAPFERRRLRFNELAVMIRRQHRELENYLMLAVDTYLILREKGEV